MRLCTVAVDQQTAANRCTGLIRFRRSGRTVVFQHCGAAASFRISPEFRHAAMAGEPDHLSSRDIVECETLKDRAILVTLSPLALRSRASCC